MKKYQFPLEKVLKIRTIELDRLVLQLNQIRLEIEKLEVRKAELAKHQLDLNEEYLNRINTNISGFELAQMNYKKENLSNQVNQLRLKINEFKQNETLVLTRVLDKKREQSGLHKLDAKLLKEFNDIALKKETAILDEMLILKMNVH